MASSNAHADVDTNGDWDEEAWFLRNQIGSTEIAQSGTGVESLHLVYTAFGEEYDLTSGGGISTRYRYAGQWGYQSDDDVMLQHVGARWYDPGSGRFMQRDPIGIKGGLNTYGYVQSQPTLWVDVLGQSPRHSHRGPGGRFARKPWWRSKKVRWNAIGVCGWIAIEVAERIIVPAIDSHADKKYKKGMKDLKKPYRKPKYKTILDVVKDRRL